VYITCVSTAARSLDPPVRKAPHCQLLNDRACGLKSSQATQPVLCLPKHIKPLLVSVSLGTAANLSFQGRLHEWERAEEQVKGAICRPVSSRTMWLNIVDP
jgi:hypothetical protein